MKTYIIFDTNVLYQSKYQDFSSFKLPHIYTNIKGKIERHELEDRFDTLIPEIAINELFQQQIEKFEEVFDQMKNNYESCKQIYGIDLKINEDFCYRTELEARKDQYLKREKIRTLPICSDIRFGSIIRRAINKKAPFEGGNKNSDKGFKDALIWESILEFAESNQGDYILITHDKGFKEYLTREFLEVTGQKITIVNKDETGLLDKLLEEQLSEQFIRGKLEKLNQNLIHDGVFSDFITHLKLHVLTNIEINNLKCSIKDVNMEDEVIGLNEVGVDLYSFKTKGSILTDKFSSRILVDIDVIVTINIDTLGIISMDIDNVEGSLISGEPLSIKVNALQFMPEENSYDMDDEEDTDVEINEVIAPITPKHTTQDEPEIYQQFTLNYVEILKDKNVEFSDETIYNLLLTLNTNATVDWIDFESTIARMRLAIRNLLKTCRMNTPFLEEIVEELLQQSITDYKTYVS